MAMPTINSDAIAQGFQTLASVLMPNPTGIMQADLMRRQGLNVDADTRYRDAQTGLTGTQQGKIQGEIDAAKALAAIFGANPDLTDPAVRAQIAAVAPLLEGGMGASMPGIVGGTTFVDPDFAGGDAAFSNILLGNGIVNSYGNTPEGQTRDHAAALSQALGVQDLRNQGAMSELQFKAANPGVGSSSTPVVPVIDPRDADLLWQNLLTSVFGGAAKDYVDAFDPATKTQLMVQLADAYQRTRSAPDAVASVMEEWNFSGTPGHDGWFSDTAPTVSVTRVQPPSAAPTPGQPSAPADAAPPPVAPGGFADVFTSPATPGGMTAPGADTGLSSVFAPALAAPTPAPAPAPAPARPNASAAYAEAGKSVRVDTGSGFGFDVYPDGKIVSTATGQLLTNPGHRARVLELMKAREPAASAPAQPAIAVGQRAQLADGSIVVWDGQNWSPE